MSRMLTLKIIGARELTPALRAKIHDLCQRAYQEDLEPLFNAYAGATHFVAFLDDTPVSHAMTVTRWLQPGDRPPLRTAYVELVATEPGFQGRGFATAILERLGRAIATDYDLGALCPADTRMYHRLGWEYWQGPLFIRPPGERHSETGSPSSALIPTPEERVMILRLPRTPPLDLTRPLSAEWRAGGELW